jgi:ribosomal protein L23
MDVVAINANKPEIKAAVETLFGVNMKAVKKAHVTLEKANAIDVATGL